MNCILGVGGGIAAYKTAEHARSLGDRGFSVQVVMTRSAREFIQPLTFAALTGKKVISDLFNAASAEDTLASSVEHIRVAQENKVLVIAPATADLIAKLARTGKSGVITLDRATAALGLDAKTSAIKLGSLARRGWLRRVRRGVYLVLPLESEPGKPAAATAPATTHSQSAVWLSGHHLGKQPDGRWLWPVMVQSQLLPGAPAFLGQCRVSDVVAERRRRAAVGHLQPRWYGSPLARAGHHHRPL